MIGKPGIITGDRLTLGEVLGLKAFAIGGEDELGLLAGSGVALPQCPEGRRDLALGADLDVNVVALEDCALQVGVVSGTGFKPADGGRLVPERFKEGKGKALRLERLFGQLRYGFLDFDGVHRSDVGRCRLVICDDDMPKGVAH